MIPVEFADTLLPAPEDRPDDHLPGPDEIERGMGSGGC